MGNAPRSSNLLIEQEFYLPARKGQFAIEPAIEAYVVSLAVSIHLWKREGHGRLIRLIPR
jgi:hypothetical protein